MCENKQTVCYFQIHDTTRSCYIWKHIVRLNSRYNVIKLLPRSGYYDSASRNKYFMVVNQTASWLDDPQPLHQVRDGNGREILYRSSF